MLAQSLGGAAEQGITVGINDLLDNYISGDRSRKEINKQIYLRQGMSEAEAEERAKKDQLNEANRRHKQNPVRVRPWKRGNGRY